MGKKKTRGKQRDDEAVEADTVAAPQPNRRKSRKDRLADPFFDEIPPEAQSDSEGDAAAGPTNTERKKKSAARDDEDSDASDEPRKGVTNAFAALNDADSESDSEEPRSQSTGGANAFASLAEEEGGDSEGEPVSSKAPGERDDDLEKSASPKKSKKKKKSGSALFDSAFAALEEEEEGVGVTEDVEENALSKKSKKKTKKEKGRAAFDSAFAALEEEGDGVEDENEGSTAVEIALPKKTKKEKGRAAFDSAFAALEEAEEPQETRSKKSKKKKELLDFDAVLNEMHDDKGEDTPIADPQPSDVTAAADELLEEKGTEEVQPLVKEKKKPKKKKKGGKAEQEEEDIDAILAEIEAKEKTIPQKEDHVRASLHEDTVADVTPAAEDAVTDVTPAAEDAVTDVTPAADNTATDVTPAAEDTATDVTPAVEEAGEEIGEEAEVDGKEVKLTAAQKKKLRKKEKKAKEKEKEAQKSEKAAKAKEEKLPAHVRKIQEQLEKKRLEEERKRQEEEAEKARLAEEERLREEAERQKEEEARRKAEAKARKEELKRQGVILTKKQKAQQARNALVREQLLKNAGIAISASGETGPSDRGSERPTLTPQEQKRIQREREEEKRRAEAQRRQAEEEERLKEEARRKEREAALAEEARQEAERQKQQAEEDAVADDWEDISSEEDEPPPVPEQKDVNGERASTETASSSDDDATDSASTSTYSEDSDGIRERQVEEARKKVEARIEEAKAAASADHLRSPICCILGHVDTGKTKILDNIRRTNVQDNEAGGITQQIGATYIPSESLQTRTAELRKGRDYDMKVPGLLVIDTPGHESFTNLRTRGSSLCDIAILVVDLMHGLEAQTLESIELLRQKKTPFIIALNKVDRLNDWKVVDNAPIRETLNRQKKHTMLHFEDRLQACTTMLMERGLNVSLYWKNKEPRRIVNMVPTSAITGEGIPDMLQLLIKLTTSLMAEKLMFLSEIQCSVLEVKAVEGLGTTVDVVLVNGRLTEGDKIVVCGMTGPIVTTIRSLLTPHPLKELRVKGSYLHHKSIQAAQGIKICAQGLEHAVAGTALRVVREDDEEECKLLAHEEMEDVMSRIDKSGEGVSVQASTLGSLEALLEFLRSPEIPVSAIAIGPVHKKDIMRANVMNEKKLKKFAVVLAFDVTVTKEAREIAEELNVTIFTADIIYHLFDQFKAYVEDVRQSEKRAASADAVFPCVLTILPTCIFNKKDPIILGCDVMEGQARVGTPLVVPAKGSQGIVALGRIESMELNHKSVQKAQRGDSVAIKIQSTCPEEAAKLYGRHFDHNDQLVSHISRNSINALKAFFKDEMSTEDWSLVVKLKKVFQVD